MKKLFRFFLITFLILNCQLTILNYCYASHNRAGEITYRWIPGDPNNLSDCTSLTYEITITTYTKTSSVLADRPSLDTVHYGDGVIESFTRLSKTNLPGDISINVYKRNHTYPGSGSYDIHFEDPNRIDSIVNIPNSFYTTFALHTTLIISPNICPRNSSPVLHYPPIDLACTNKIFIHNAVAVDPDNDSLSYELTIPRAQGGLPIQGYSYPIASNSFTLNPITGDLIWDSPVDTGEYNMAFYIVEWRNGKRIGQVERDMQVKVLECDNNPPIINAHDTCVLGGSTIDFIVTAIDKEGDIISMSSYGEPYSVSNKATFTPDSNNGLNDTVNAQFSWNTSCLNVRRNPYWVEFKAQDDGDTDLVNLKGVFIRIIGPPVQNLNAFPAGNSMQLTWSLYSCANAKKFNIYRRNNPYPGTIECPCTNGVPSSTGYVLIGTTSSINDTSFIDSNNGNGLSIGGQYCYLVTAVFSDGSESCASNEVCQLLKKVLPVLTNVDVDTTDANIGSIRVVWSPATDLDTTQFPFKEYRLYRVQGTNRTLLVTYTNWNDTIFYDELLNTDVNQYTYQLELYTDSNGVASLRGSPPKATSVFLSIAPTDRKLILTWKETVPWNNYRYDIYKENPQTFVYDSIGTTTAQTFTDINLSNDSTYCYKVKSVGTYGAPNIKDTLENWSQIECGRPVDNVAPCPPVLTVFADCSVEANLLEWTNPHVTCNDSDVAYYKVYRSPDTLQHYEVIATINNPDTLRYLHNHLTTTVGCYKVTAVDVLGNESDATPVCVDTCRQYVLPNVFTPNGDGMNDLFKPCNDSTDVSLRDKCPPYKNVRDVEMKIFNRWGTLVFETTDKDINWDGKNKDSGGNCPDGTYYYTCTVNFLRLNGSETKELHGYIHLIRGK